MSYCSDCIGGFSVRRKINGEKFRPNFRATTTDMLQINEQICSDNYEIDANTLMPKPTLSCGADGQPENLDFQFYEDRKCDGIQDCENGFDESDCEEMIKLNEKPGDHTPITRREFVLMLQGRGANCELRCQVRKLKGLQK